MTSILKAALSAAILTGFANSAGALDLTATINPFNSHMTQEIALFDSAELKEVASPTLPASATIGIARLDGGRMITTPYSEADDWADMANALNRDVRPLSAGAYLNAVPDVDMNGRDSDNKIDEIRLAAVDSGMDYVLIYGIFDDAHFASFGGKALRETGLTVPYGSASWQRGDAKALLVNSYSGDVIGAVTTWAPDMPTLTTEVGAMITKLSDTV